MPEMTNDQLYQLPRGVETRWITAENPTGSKGKGASVGDGRKSAPCRHPLKAGESFIMAEAEGPGTIRRIWITLSDRSPLMLRGIRIEIFWDGCSSPAVSAPIGDFFCSPLGRSAAFENAWFSSPEGRSFNCILPMPFQQKMAIRITNGTGVDLAMFFYEVNYTIGDCHSQDTPYFHACYRRENPTRLVQDFEILPLVAGRGRFLGCCIGVNANTSDYGNTWWGEGEVKIYMDGDADYPTLCGTGTEDYIGTGWGQGFYSHRYQGNIIADSENMQYGFYRLHGPDPVYFQENIRVTIQQIGSGDPQQMIDALLASGRTELDAPGYGSPRITLAHLRSGQIYTHNFERHDDWCATAYFYLDRPYNGLNEAD